MKTLNITVLDKDGNVLADNDTKEKWCISEAQYFMNPALIDIHKGRAASIIITDVTPKE